MIQILGGDVFASAGASVREPQKPADPGKGIRLGVRVEPNPCHGKRGKSLGARDPNGRSNNGVG